MTYDIYQMVVIDSKNAYWLHIEDGVDYDRAVRRCGPTLGVHFDGALKGITAVSHGSAPPPSFVMGQKMCKNYAPMPPRYIGKPETRERRERAKRARARARAA